MCFEVQKLEFAANLRYYGSQQVGTGFRLDILGGYSRWVPAFGRRFQVGTTGGYRPSDGNFRWVPYPPGTHLKWDPCNTGLVEFADCLSGGDGSAECVGDVSA